MRHHTSHVLSGQNILARNPGLRGSVKQLHQLTQGDLEALLPETDPVLAVPSAFTVLACLSPQLHTVEKAVRNRLKHTPASEPL